MAWLPLVVVAVAQITMRLAGIAGKIWQERVRAKSHCDQMRCAAAGGVMLIEWHEDGGLAIIPQDMPSLRKGAVVGPGPEGAPVA